jgi:hypothetical protein
MPQRFGVTPDELCAATTALAVFQPVDLVALVRPPAGALALDVTQLSAARLLRLWFGRGGLGVRILAR